MNRNATSRVATRPVRPTALRSVGPRPQPKKSGILGRIFRWFVFLGIVGAIAASFFVKAPDGNTYADLYTKPAYRWAKDKIFPPEPEPETAVTVKKEAAPAAPSELDKKFEEIVAEREKAGAAKPPDAADEAVTFLEKQLEAAAGRIDAVREIGLEASKTALKKTKVGAAQVMEELVAQARVQKEIAAALVTRKSAQDVKAALAAVPPPPPPVAAPAPAPPPVVPYDFKKFHAWPAQPAGTWVRWKKTVDGAISFEDYVMVTVTEDAAVIRIMALPGNQATADRVFVYGADKARVVREESMKVGDAEIACRVVQSGSTLRWIPKDGPGADRVALKEQTGDQTSVVTELGEEEIPVKGEPKKCLKSKVGDATVWGNDDVPGFVARVKTGNAVSEVVEWGTDLASRPIPSKLTPAEAEALTSGAAALLREVIEEMKDPSLSTEALKELLSKTDSAASLFDKAKEAYLWQKGTSPNPAVFEEKITKLGRALEIAAQYTESIKAKLK